MAVEDYEELQNCTQKEVDLGSNFDCDSAYYSARKVMPPRQDNDEDGAVIYNGKLRDTAFAVSIDNVKIVQRQCVIDGNPPRALSALIIAYECTQNPTATAKHKFHRTNTHHASCGTLHGDVFCIIEAKHTFIP